VLSLSHHHDTARPRRYGLFFSAFAATGAIFGLAGWGWSAIGRAADQPKSLHAVLELALPGRPHSSLRVHRFRLPMHKLHVEVVDLHYERLVADALEDGAVVVNGGYWGFGNNQRRVLVGLLNNAGKELSPLRAGLDGGVLVLDHGKAKITASRGYAGPSAPDLALQCSPRLLSDRTIVPKLNADRRAARTAVCVRDAGATLDVYLTDPAQLGPSLYDFASWLLAQGCEHALNLDGGPSTAAAYREDGRVVKLGPGRELPYALRFRYSDP
jgi:hypothetical protein